jgi:hypothetical protein
MGNRASALLLCLAMASTAVACDTRPALSFAPDALPNATIGVPYRAVITVSGNQTPVFQMSADVGLPPGLALVYDADARGSQAALSGTPTVAGTYNVTISAWCLGTNVSGQTGSHQYRIVVFAPELPSAT